MCKFKLCRGNKKIPYLWANTRFSKTWKNVMVGPKKTKFSVIIHFTNHDILISTMSQNVTTMTFLLRNMTFSKLFKKQQTTRTIYFRENYKLNVKFLLDFVSGGWHFYFHQENTRFSKSWKNVMVGHKKPNFQL